MGEFDVLVLLLVVIIWLLWRQGMAEREIFVIKRQYYPRREDISLKRELESEYFEAFLSYDAAKAYYDWWDQNVVGDPTSPDDLEVSLSVVHMRSREAAIRRVRAKRGGWYPLLGPNHKALRQARDIWLAERKLDREIERKKAAEKANEAT